MPQKARLETFDETGWMIEHKIIDDFNPLEPDQSHHIPSGTKMFRLTPINEDGTDADKPETFVVGTRTEIVGILTMAGNEIQAERFLSNFGDESEEALFVAIDQTDRLACITKIR